MSDETTIGSVWNRPIDEFVNEISEYDSIAFRIVRRIFSKTLGGEPEGPEPTGFKMLVEIYEPKGGLVQVQPMSMPSGLLFFMDFKYEATTQENKIHELD
jgi:hypothetical protein